jgi:hypothetical protein
MEDADVAMRTQALKKWMVDMEREQGRRDIASRTASDEMQRQADFSQNPIYRILAGMATGTPYSFSSTLGNFQSGGTRPIAPSYW